MATVTVNIDGKTYRMACEEGQENHLLGLAKRLDQYISHLKASFGEIGDHRLAVMAGIMIMDEMAEMDKNLQAVRQENDSLRQQQNNHAHEFAERDAELTSALDNFATRLETVAQRILPR